MVHILIRYLGIKTKLLEPIKLAVDAVTPRGAGVLDLFAGSSTVGQYLMDDYTVYANDYQAYSYIAAKALIGYHSPELIRSIDAPTVFGSYYQENLDQLKKRFSTPLAAEQRLLEDIGETYYGPAFDRFTDYFNRSPYAEHTDDAHPAFCDCLDFFGHEQIAGYRRDHSLFPYSLFTLYYGNPYFSLHQCIEIDSIKYSIDMLLKEQHISRELHDIYLSFLIYCLNLIVISVGDHFAQPQKIKTVSPDLSGDRDRIHLREHKKIITKKRTLVKDLYLDKLADYKTNYRPGSKLNEAFCLDCKALLASDELKARSIKTVYIDPPYTNAHYSRFYHIPETLVLYDYPEIEFFGRYRTDRYQSGFCIKTQAADEFSAMLRLCRANGYNAIISYSDTAQCILSIDDIKDICGRCYRASVKTENIAHMYRNFGQKPNRVLAKEYIITCFV